MTHIASVLSQIARQRRALFDHMRAAVDRGDDTLDFTALDVAVFGNARQVGANLKVLEREGALISTIRAFWRYGKRWRGRIITFTDGKVLKSAPPKAPPKKTMPRSNQDRLAIMAYIRGLAERREHMPVYDDCAKACGISKRRFILAISCLHNAGEMKSVSRRRGGATRYIERNFTFPDGVVVSSAPYTPKKLQAKEEPPAPRQLDERVTNLMRGTRTVQLKYGNFNLPDSALYRYSVAEQIRTLRAYGDDVALPRTRGVVVHAANDDGWLVINNILHSPEEVAARVARASGNVGVGVGTRPQTNDLIARYGRS